MKNIILLVPNLDMGGQERVAVNTAEILSDGYNVKLVLFDGSKRKYNTESDVIDLNVPTKPGKLYKVINVIRRVIKLNALKRKMKCDLVYSFGTSANMVNCICGGKGKRLIAVHAYGTTKLNCLEKLFYKRADKIFCVSKLIKQTLDERYPCLSPKTEVLYNPYDFSYMIESGKEDISDYVFDKPTVISTGRLNQIKNFARLIKAFSIVSGEIDCKLLIVGEGEERERLEALIDKYNLSDKVTLIGYRSNPFKYLAKSTLFVLSSYSEGFPNSLIEGMTFCPAVSVDCKSGPREILSDDYSEKIDDYEIVDYGILVADADIRTNDDNINTDDEKLARAIIHCFNDSELLADMKEKAHQRALEFSFDKYRKILTEYI